MSSSSGIWSTILSMSSSFRFWSALPVVDLLEYVEIRLHQADVDHHRRVRRQAELLLQLSRSSFVGSAISLTRVRPGSDQVGTNLIDLEPRQARRLSLDELLVKVRKLLEIGDVPAVDVHLDHVLHDRDETDGRVGVAPRGEALKG